MNETSKGELEQLSLARDDIDQKIKDLRSEKANLSRKIHGVRSTDIGLSHDEIVVNRGYRAYVGGPTPERWYGIGKLQFHWLVSAGLRPDSVFLDVACGSLRLGQFLIPYLNQGNYFGLDGSERLIEQGLENEVFFDIAAEKQPKFSSNYDFDFSFIDRFDFAIAQSLVTHLALDDVRLMLENLRTVADERSVFFFTFFEGDEKENKHEVSHPNKNWKYKFETLQDVARQTGWALAYVGDWNHPSNQMMVKATIR